jgi:hypothetical protein
LPPERAAPIVTRSDRLGVEMDSPASRSIRVRATRIGVAAIGLVLLAACTTRSGASPSSTYTYSPPVVINEPNSQHGPYVVVAVDNHFHDIHPTDPPTIAANRPFEVKNEGYNLHNFSVIGTHISIDIPPGGHFRWSHIGTHLKPGTYQVVCTYHAYLGMVGLFTVAPANKT